jgi:hypothetical protein
VSGGETRVWIGQLPPSMNALMYAHWRKRRDAKRAWQNDLHVVLLAEQLPRPLAHVTATANLIVPTRQRRDEGNFRWLIEKALGDALTAGGWLADDDPRYYTFGALSFEHVPRVSRTEITLAWDRPIG